MKKGQKDILQDIWDKEAESYSPDAESSPDYLAHFKEVEEAMGNVRGKMICDIGSGTGITSAYLASLGAQLTLVDISQKALNFQKKYFRTNKLAAKYIRRDAFKLQFPNNSFDVVWNGGVIEHFKDTEKIEMMKIMWKLVKPGGILVIAAPNAYDLPFMAAKQILLWRKKWGFGYEDDLTAGRMKNLAQKARVTNYSIYAYNPVVGWWFFPYGKEITNFLHLNNTAFHRIRIPTGHNLIFKAQKINE